LRAYESAGYDLNEGMLFEYKGTVYFGGDAVNGLRNLKSGNFEFACSRILAFPFDVAFGLGDPIVVDLDQHGADKSD